MLDSEIIKKITKQYHNLTRFQRFHLSKRLKWCQYDHISSFLPEKGLVLDIGCGYGHFCVYLSLAKPLLQILGCDIDEKKISIAKTIDLNKQNQYDFLCGNIVSLNPLQNLKFDSIVILDVLYLVPVQFQKEILKWVSSHLKSKGVLIIKTIDTEKGIRSKLAIIQEYIMIVLLRKTKATNGITHEKSPNFYVEILKQLDFDINTIPLSENRTPSLLITAIKK